jgi:hypothetical protein
LKSLDAVAGRTVFPAKSTTACIAVASYLFLAWFPALSSVALVVLATCLASAFLFGRFSTTLGDRWLNGLLVAFLAASSVSALLGIDPQRSLAGCLPMIPAVAVFMLVAYQFEGRRQVVLALSALIFAAFVTSLGMLAGVAGSGPSDLRLLVQSLGSQFVVPNDLAALSILAPFPMAVALSDGETRARRISALVIVVIFACAVVAARSRLGALLFVLSGVLTVAATSRRGKMHAAKGMATLIGALAIPALTVDGLLGWPLLSKTNHLADTRLPLWEVAIQMIAERPILGNGPNTFGLAWDVHLAQASASSLALNGERTPWCHSLPLEVAAERGIAGLLALLGVCWRICHLIVRRLDSSDSVLVVPLAISFLLFSLAALFELTLLRQWVVTMLFLYAGIVSVLSKPARQ